MFIISQSQNRDQHKPVVNMDMKIRMPREAGNFWVGKWLRASATIPDYNTGLAFFFKFLIIYVFKQTVLVVKFKTFRIRKYKAWVVVMKEQEKMKGVEKDIKDNLIK
jgi:hypothetical protein